MGKKSYKQFYHGKLLSKTQQGSKPMRWFPRTYIDTYNSGTGLFRSRRKFGEDGWVYKDMDVADNHRPYDHAHDIYKGNRSDARDLKKFERQELEKAKSKRRYIQ